MSDVVVVDVGVGNLHSVQRALQAALGEGVVITRSDDAARVRDASAVVFPGQGAFGDCAVALHRHGAALTRALADHLAADRPYLGICLGLQVLFEGSDEAPGRAGLGILPGDVMRLRGGTDAAGERVKIPHMGWNTAQVQGEGSRYIPDGGWFYFVHSFAVRPRDPSVIAAVTDHGEKFCSAVARGRMLGVQFHPEKSQREGLALITRWARETGVTA